MKNFVKMIINAIIEGFPFNIFRANPLMLENHKFSYVRVRGNNKRVISDVWNDDFKNLKNDFDVLSK